LRLRVCLLKKQAEQRGENRFHRNEDARWWYHKSDFGFFDWLAPEGEVNHNWICSATPLVEGWVPGFGGLCGLKRIFGGLAATFFDKKTD
jgi:hypothetical protein